MSIVAVLLSSPYVYAAPAAGSSSGGTAQASQNDTSVKPQPSVILKPELLPGPRQVERPGTSQDSPFDTNRFRDYFLGPNGFVSRYLPGFLGFIAIAAVFVIIVGGIIFLTAFGDEEKIGTAKKVVQWAIIGLILAMLAYAIVNILLRLPLPLGTPAQGPAAR